MPWHAHLQLDYRLESSRTVARFKHDGPLRILQSLYPEGDAVCHNVLVHPPGGLVGGDTLDIRLSAAAGAHGLVTTPGATRFYKSAGEAAVQRSVLKVEEGARMEWLPLEAIAYNGCRAHNELRFELASGAELIGWDITALGLPHAQQPFALGRFQQHIEFPGVWLERGCIDAADTRLLDSPLGLAGNRCLASIFFAAGDKLPRERRQQALDAARALIEAHPLRATAGATSPDGQVIVVRALAPLVEPAMDLMRKVWQAWRGHFWAMPAASPRIWST
ncbi:MAG TPA: urease accessory protein UreD [Burkholderiaceae bacterium]|nr:urease accessory protein UreD [Burkholderiaceae bacterium]